MWSSIVLSFKSQGLRRPFHHWALGSCSYSTAYLRVARYGATWQNRRSQKVKSCNNHAELTPTICRINCRRSTVSKRKSARSVNCDGPLPLLDNQPPRRRLLDAAGVRSSSQYRWRKLLAPLSRGVDHVSGPVKRLGTDTLGK